jgi:ketosteroid isomerase-like protein
MMDTATDPVAQPAVELAVRFVRAVESGAGGADFLTDDAVEEELPNRIFPGGAVRDVAAMRAGMEKGKKLFKYQRYDLRRALGDRDTAVLELDWSGELAVPVGSLKAGDVMRATCAFFFEVKDGRIARLRHYDAFEPF